MVCSILRSSEDVFSIADPTGRISVTLTTSEATPASRAEAAEERLRAKKKANIGRMLEDISSTVKFVQSVRGTPNVFRSQDTRTICADNYII